MLIKIICGNFGCNNGECVRVKTPSDPPFSVGDEEARRLVGLGIAEIVGKETVIPSIEEIPDAIDESEIPQYDETMTNAALQAIAKEHGVEIPLRATKTEIIKALDDYFADMPDLSAEV